MAMHENVTFSVSNIGSQLLQLPRTDPKVYAGRVGVGHPDEIRLNQMYGGLHWTEMTNAKLDAIAKNFEYDELILLTVSSFCLLLPGFLLSNLPQMFVAEDPVAFEIVDEIESLVALKEVLIAQEIELIFAVEQMLELLTLCTLTKRLPELKNLVLLLVRLIDKQLT